MKPAFASWSGGKDCCLAFYRAQAGGLHIRYLLNMVTEDGRLSRSHGLAAKWLQTQAEAMGIPLIQRRTTDGSYEAEFKGALASLKSEGILSGVFGDIDFNAHRGWIDRVCAETSITPYLPLWEENQSKLLREFIGLGFEAVVVATRADMLGEEWLGRRIDLSFMSDLARLKNITPCGEAGEYHSLVVDGPLFRQRMELGKTSKVRMDGHWFLDIAGCDLKPKKSS